ncbi:reverse transcriptase domain-containing protein [Tanacetum coccineum]
MQEVILFYNGLEVSTRQILDSKGAIPTKTVADAKVKEKVYATHVGCELCKGPHYTKYCLLKEEGKTLEEAYYTQFGVPFQQGGQYKAATLGFYQRNNANPSRLNAYYCDEKGSYGPQYLEAYSYGATCLDDSLPRKEKDPGSFTLPCYINNICFENALADLGASVSVMPLSAYLNLVGIGKFVFPVDFIILDMPEDVKVPLILRRPFLSTAHAKIDVFKRKIILKVGYEKIIFKSVKPASSLIKRVNMLSFRERMELDLEARLMGENLILNKSLDPLYGDYIELNDLNVPLELRRDQVNDLMPTIEEREVVDKHVIKEVKTRNDDKMVSKIFGYPSGYKEDEKIRIDYAYNLKISCMIGFEFVHANFFPNFPINVMSKKFYNSIMKDKIEFRRRNELGNFSNVPIFIGNFYVITDFIVVEDMDPYLDKGMGEVVVGELFAKFRMWKLEGLIESLLSAKRMLV